MSFLKNVYASVVLVVDVFLKVLDDALLSVPTSTWITLSVLFFILSFLGQVHRDLDHHNTQIILSSPSPSEDDVCLPTDIVYRGQVYGH